MLAMPKKDLIEIVDLFDKDNISIDNLEELFEEKGDEWYRDDIGYRLYVNRSELRRQMIEERRGKKP